MDAMQRLSEMTDAARTMYLMDALADVYRIADKLWKYDGSTPKEQAAMRKAQDIVRSAGY